MARSSEARQRDIIARLAVPGASIRSVAHDLGLAESTVKNSLTDLYRRLGVASALQAYAALVDRPVPARGDPPDEMTVAGHRFAHIAACPCPRRGRASRSTG